MGAGLECRFEKKMSEKGILENLSLMECEEGEDEGSLCVCVCVCVRQETLGMKLRLYIPPFNQICILVFCLSHGIISAHSRESSFDEGRLSIVLHVSVV